MELQRHFSILRVVLIIFRVDHEHLKAGEISLKCVKLSYYPVFVNELQIDQFLAINILN